jgi:isocitrate dehydrogenase
VEFQKTRFPEGDRIRHEDGHIIVGDRPVVGLLRGDGIGVDVTPVMRSVVEAAVAQAYEGKRRIAWAELHAGLEGLRRYGRELPDQTVEAIREIGVAIKGPFTTPVGEEQYVCLRCARQQDHSGPCEHCGAEDGMTERFRSINVRLCQQLDLFASVRPVQYLKGVPSPNRNADRVNFVIFRENTEDLYGGHDFPGGGEVASAIIDLVRARTGREIARDSGIGLKTISPGATRRLVRKALQWAVSHGVPSVTLVHKGNIMKFTEGAFVKWAYELAREEFGEVTVTERELRQRGEEVGRGKVLLRDRIADSVFQRIQTRPEEFHVLVLSNLNGDYLSDAAAAVVGGLGPSANLSDELALFEATHGTAPRRAGLDLVNPTPLLLSAVMMLDHLGWSEAATLVTRGVSLAIRDRHVTYDLAGPLRRGGRRDVVQLSCSGFGKAVVARMSMSSPGT